MLSETLQLRIAPAANPATIGEPPAAPRCAHIALLLLLDTQLLWRELQAETQALWR